jgi:hypothetical protein
VQAQFTCNFGGFTLIKLYLDSENSISVTNAYQKGKKFLPCLQVYSLVSLLLLLLVVVVVSFWFIGKGIVFF